MSVLQEIRDRLLQLPQADRAALAHDLLLSLEPTTEKEPGYDKAWALEIQARSDAYHRGELEAVDVAEAIEGIRQSLREKPCECES